jgi:hypothetical protein
MKTICDKCIYYEVSPGGCVETCHARKINYRLTESFFDQRRTGESNQCAYSKVIFDGTLNR